MSDRDQPKPEDAKDPQVQAEVITTLPAGATPGDVALEPELQAYIGMQLKATYDEVLNEPVPDRFLELLRELEADKDNDRGGES